MKGIWKEREWKEVNAKWKEHACKWMQNEIWKEHEVLPKHLKPTKQLLDPFPSLSRNGFWFRVGSRICWFPQNPGKRMAPPKSDNHNNSNYSDVKEFDGNSNQSVHSRTGKGGWNNCNHAFGAGAVPLYRPCPNPPPPWFVDFGISVGSPNKQQEHTEFLQDVEGNVPRFLCVI